MSTWNRVVQLWRIVSSWCARTWNSIRPGPEAKRGAVWGTLVAALAAVVTATLTLHSGFGYLFDLAFSALVAALGIPLIMLLIALLMTIARHLPRMATGMIIGSCTLVMLISGGPQVGIAMAVAIGLSMGILGATIATLVTGAFSRASTAKRIVTVSLAVLSLAANVFLVWFLGSDGSTDKLISWKPPSMPEKLVAPNPSATGPYSFKLLFYGVGNDIRRPEYGKSVAIKTHTIDTSLFFKDFKGWKRWIRRKYWGFDIDKLPLNGRVWYPEGPGPFPLVLIVHGNHNMSEFSDPGYAYLGELLASRGFILASIDENFLNSGLFHDPPKQQAVRGLMLLEHLELFKAWNRSAGNPFQGKVDMTRIALMGHSRGGEAVATAALFNRLKYDPDDANIRFAYGFDIKSVIAIAPVDGQYKPAGRLRWIEDVNYLTLQGAYDADVSSFNGSRQWDHVLYTKPGRWFKAEIYAYNANHGQFNTVWGRSDAGSGPGGWLLNLKPLMPGDQQRRISKTYITAFLEATLNNRNEYIPLFEDWRVGRDWLPNTLFINRYQDSSYIPIAGYQEDADLTTATAPGATISANNLTVWREAPIPWRRGNREYNGVFLGWNRTKGGPIADYTISFPPTRASALQISVAALDEDAPLPDGKKPGDKEKKIKKDREAPDFTIELISDGNTIASAPMSRFNAVPPPFKEKFTKLPFEDFRYEKDWEPVFQTVRMPYSAPQITKVRLKFDKTPAGVICISGIGFESTPPPDPHR